MPVLAAACAVEVGEAEPAADTGVQESAEAIAPSEELGKVAQAATCRDVSGTLTGQSLAVTDPLALQKFGLRRTINSILATANVSPTETNVGVYQRWMRTFGPSSAPGGCNDPRIDPNDYGLVCPRTEELRLSTINPMESSSTVKFVPVALMNRFDLAPANGANCGEYRIVYAMNSQNPNIGGRAFIIFEAALPNPTPAQGLAACLPVAQFWQSLSSDNSDVSRAAKLEKFYFTGGAVPGFPAIVNAAHYGLANADVTSRSAGQIRTNFFVNNQEWHLREFRLNRTCIAPDQVGTCKLEFTHVTVKQNPAEELFSGTHALSPRLLKDFLRDVPRLAVGDVNAISMRTNNVFNEFESVSQASNVQYSLVASREVRRAIKNRLSEIGSSLSVNNILDRATTQTCAGCHQVSNGASLGGGLTWPNANSFVHVDEFGNLSPALVDVFLPRRKVVLETFINNLCDGTGARIAEPGLTVSGSFEGAVN
jgi:hypothetical protein